jgi:hypothetical protein
MICPYSLCPFFGDPCDDGSMHVCITDQLNDFLSSHPLTTIRPPRMGSRGKSMNTSTVDVVVPSGLMLVIQLMVKPAMLMWVQFLMTTLMWMKIRIIGIRIRK